MIRSALILSLLSPILAFGMMISTGIQILNPPFRINVGCNLASDYQLEPVPADGSRFAIIGDFGSGNAHAEQVADLVKSWNPAFIVTLGDNNYFYGEASTIEKNITQFYGDYIDSQQFYPLLGNHDWKTDKAQPYLDYFTLPGNEYYYTFTQGSVQFFILNSAPDGRISDTSEQAIWLKRELAQSEATFKLVLMHHPPFSSGAHGSSSKMQWPFAAWGADAVLAGHEHDYERLTQDGIPYFVNGLGGAQIRPFRRPIKSSQVQYNCHHGAMLVDATSNTLTFRFIAVDGQLIDSTTINRP